MWGVSLYGQHAPQYSNFMFNKLAYNPAYAGSHEMLTLSAIYRNQWMGLDGAPETMNINIHTPFLQNRCGLGLTIASDKIGMLNTTYLNLSYAYRLQVTDQATLSIGLMGRIENGRTDWTKADPIHKADQEIGDNMASVWKPNFGGGLYLTNSKYYVGLSAPQILKNTIYSEFKLDQDIRSYYLMGGFVTSISKNIKIKPAVLLTYNPSAPFEMDLNLNFIFMDALWLGASYRLGDSVDAIVAYQFNKQLRAGLAFDFTTSELRNYSSGSFEVLLQYGLSYEKADITNLRYF